LPLNGDGDTHSHLGWRSRWCFSPTANNLVAFFKNSAILHCDVDSAITGSGNTVGVMHHCCGQCDQIRRRIGAMLVDYFADLAANNGHEGNHSENH